MQANLLILNMNHHNTSYIIDILDLVVFKLMEKDFIRGITIYGPAIFSSILFEKNIISSSNLNLIGLLSKYLSPRNVSVILVEILASNMKDQTVFKNFIMSLRNLSSLRYLYSKINMLYG